MSKLGQTGKSRSEQIFSGRPPKADIQPARQWYEISGAAHAVNVSFHDGQEARDPHHEPRQDCPRGGEKGDHGAQPVEHGPPAIGAARTVIDVADRDAGRTGGIARTYRHVGEPERCEDESKTDEANESPDASSGPHDVDTAHGAAPFRESVAGPRRPRSPRHVLQDAGESPRVGLDVHGGRPDAAVPRDLRDRLQVDPALDQARDQRAPAAVRRGARYARLAVERLEEAGHVSG
jgi:hypothetical protein